MVFKEHSCLFLDLDDQGPKIQTKGLKAWLSLLFTEYGVTGFKEPVTKALELHSLRNCFDASFEVF